MKTSGVASVVLLIAVAAAHQTPAQHTPAQSTAAQSTAVPSTAVASTAVQSTAPRTGSPSGAAAPAPAAAAALTLAQVRDSPSRVVLADIEPAAARDRVQLTRTWRGDFCASTLVNRGATPVRVKEVVLFSIAHALPPDTAIYGESFQMLSQTGGTLATPIDYGYSELKHYRIPQPADVTVATGLVTLTPPPDPDGRPRPSTLLAFTSSRRFVSRFYLRAASIEIVADTEGLVLAPGERWTLEELFVASAPRTAPLLDRLAARINEHHPPLRVASAPTGWCSWYCFGPRVTAQQVLDNLDTIAKKIPRLEYVQIDDGYQPAMGDWLDTGAAFGGDVLGVLKQIRQRGFQPAIWVAPFIAEAGSRLFTQHPDWFIKGEDGKPLPSNQVTFGGWRRGPWYALDGTHPEVQRHFESLFRTMSHEWGVTYFKLDANFWGAMHGGRLHDPKATRVEAYRRGMQAVLRGAGDGFILRADGLLERRGSRAPRGDVHAVADAAALRAAARVQAGRMMHVGGMMQVGGMIGRGAVIGAAFEQLDH